jgi:hypothetical protein
MRYFSKIKQSDANVGRPVECVTLICSRVGACGTLLVFKFAQILLCKGCCVLIATVIAL